MTSKFVVKRVDAFATLAEIDLSGPDLDSVLGRLVELAARAIPDVAGASVTLSRGDHASTVVFAGELVRLLDETQYELGHGPCLQAFGTGDTVVANDMSAERRWPRFAAGALDVGCHSSMSIGFPGHEWAAGALNVAATAAQTFDDYAVVVGRAIAAHAAVALAHAHVSAALGALDRQRRAVPGACTREPLDGVGED